MRAGEDLRSLARERRLSGHTTAPRHLPDFWHCTRPRKSSSCAEGSPISHPYLMKLYPSVQKCCCRADANVRAPSLPSAAFGGRRQPEP